LPDSIGFHKKIIAVKNSDTFGKKTAPRKRHLRFNNPPSQVNHLNLDDFTGLVSIMQKINGIAGKQESI